ncbi:MAG TPA: hypothetical protein VLZ89_03955, partial [Anaerolineales bacterium]|nr:hypothetical protein [Anaerolineales bacterium]
MADSLFQYDFETGNLTGFPTATPPVPGWSTIFGSVSNTTSSSYLGDNGMQLILGGHSPGYVEDDSPNNEASYNARFYMNPAGVTMDPSDTLDLFDGCNDGLCNTNVFTAQLQENTPGAYNIRAGLEDNNGVLTYTSWYPLSVSSSLPIVPDQNWNAVELDYRVGTSGSLALYINGALQQTLGNVDNGTLTISSLRLGAQNLVYSNSGTLYFDNFESRRFSYIGTLFP